MTEEKFEQIVNEYSNMVLKIAVANLNHLEDARDVTQEVFIKLYKKEDFVDDDHIKRWLIRVTVNQCHDMQRLFYRKNRLPFDDAYLVSDSESVSIQEELNLLKSDERVYVYLHYIEGYSYREIAELLNKNENTIASKVRRALKKLRMMLQEDLL